MIGASANKFKEAWPETKSSVLSAVPVALALLLHGVHMLVVSVAAAGTAGMEMHMHHDAMVGMAASESMAHHFGSAMSWMTALAIALNACGSYFAARMLWKVGKSKRRDRHARLCCAVAVVSLAVGIASTGLLL
jgi:hypothetical protein